MGLKKLSKITIGLGAYIVLSAAFMLQAILPYRYGELKDFITNIMSGVMGITLLFVLQNKRPFPD